LLPGPEGLASKGVGRSMDTVNFFMAILFQCPFFQGIKTDSWQNYMHQQLDIVLSLDDDDEIDIINFAGIIYYLIPLAS